MLGRLGWLGRHRTHLPVPMIPLGGRADTFFLHMYTILLSSDCSPVKTVSAVLPSAPCAYRLD
jgi:hypothetical protein